jgi:hypothetical protein
MHIWTVITNGSLICFPDMSWLFEDNLTAVVIHKAQNEEQH